MNYSRIIFLFGLTILSFTVSGQDKPIIKASVDKNRILLGEPFNLVIESSQKEGVYKSWSAPDSIPHFEFLEKPAVDSTVLNGIVTTRYIYKITSFDSGHWMIGDTIPVDVGFADFDPNKDYNSIKDIIEVKAPKQKPWWLWVAGGALIVAAVAFYLLRRKKPVKVAKPQVLTDPYEEARQGLRDLQRTKTDAKTFYSALTNILRLYLFRRKGILSLQKTTDDLVLQLKGLLPDHELYDRVSQSLRLSDFVKFAKYLPGEEDNQSSFKNISDYIDATERETVLAKAREGQKTV